MALDQAVTPCGGLSQVAARALDAGGGREPTLARSTVYLAGRDRGWPALVALDAGGLALGYALASGIGPGPLQAAIAELRRRPRATA